MKREVFFILILAIVACGAARKISPPLTDGRIVGGEETTIDKHPYQISLVYVGSHRCGGSIITEYFVLTAAHCVYDLSDNILNYLQIRVGSSHRTSGGILHSISYFTWHSSFTDETFVYDIALIRVKLPFVFGATVQPIELPSPGYTLADGTVLTVSGWGKLTSGGFSPYVLQEVHVPLLNNTHCAALYAYYNEVRDSMICAGYIEGQKDACQGDSGGPLVYGNTLIGIVSWGDGCAAPSQPGVYADVEYLRDWVIEQTGLFLY